MNIPSDLFLVNQEDPEKEEEDYIILNKIYGKKPNSIFQKEKYEKFKPKQKIEIEKIDSTMLTAENKVKSLLSSFLHDLKAEQKIIPYEKFHHRKQYRYVAHATY